MNKKTKGWIAAGLGGALLLGTGGTFALWHDTANLESASIATGDLALDGATITWTWENVSHPGDLEKGDDVAANALLVPGDAITGLIEFGDSVLTGDTIVAQLSLAGVGPSGGIAPLVVLVDGDEVVPSDDGEVILPSVLRPGGTGSLDAVELTIGFPVAEEPVLPVPDGPGYGRNMTAIPAGALQVRLVQQVDGEYFVVPDED